MDKLNEIKYKIKMKVQSLLPWGEEEAKQFEFWYDEFKDTVRQEVGVNVFVNISALTPKLVVTFISFYRGEIIDACSDCLVVK